jgi:segregation and condensation protein B
MDGVCPTLDPMTDSENASDLQAPGLAGGSASDDSDAALGVDGESGTSRHPADAAPIQDIQPVRVVEAILFASDCPLAPARVAAVLGVGDARDVRSHIKSLNEQYAAAGLSFRIEEIAGGYQMMTLPAYNTWLAKLLRAREDTKLSPAAMESLAIVAYKQPVTRADIEAIRGVAAGDMLQRLRELNLVKIVGRAEDLGRPMLYGTTKHFLEVFGLPSLEELPQVEALRKPEPSGRKAAEPQAGVPPPEPSESPSSPPDVAGDSAPRDADAPAQWPPLRIAHDE